ncbi:MAG TPA: DUF433 domain-containing protein [Dehalococcoidia bacterium]|nr:DUF433 domain-containing protein [Dehalococcoidia bacterium]
MAKVDAREIAPRIVVDPDVHFGKAVIKGTRVPIEVILEQLALGGSVADVADEYGVSIDDVLAVLKYAHDVIASEEVRAV